MKTLEQIAIDLLNYYGNREDCKGLVKNAAKVLKKQGVKVLKTNFTTIDRVNPSNIEKGALFPVVRETKAFYYILETFPSGHAFERKVNKENFNLSGMSKHWHQFKLI